MKTPPVVPIGDMVLLVYKVDKMITFCTNGSMSPGTLTFLLSLFVGMSEYEGPVAGLKN